MSARNRIEFEAPEYHADTSIAPARYRFEGSEGEGWRILRNDRPHLELGAGYRALRTESCGVCSTDLARHFLPFPLPQVTGHELVARDDRGARCVVEINASHHARGASSDCAFCGAGLHTHCPERLVLGIHDLPGGFGPWILAPVHAIHRLPDAVPSAAAVLIEPLAAAQRAITTLFPEDTVPAGLERVAVLGPRRLGLLVVAVLAAWREQHGHAFEILALARHAELLERARAMGATETRLLGTDGEGLEDGCADVVIDTTGSPAGLELAIRAAQREVHLKSTHGREAAGVQHLTELVVDEIALEGTARGALESCGERVAWLSSAQPPEGLAERCELLRTRSAADALAQLEAHAGSAHGGLPRADVAVVDDAQQVAQVIRPIAGREVSLVRPRGRILVQGTDHDAPLLSAIAQRGLRLTSSRCGDFAMALDLMERDRRLLALGTSLVTHRFSNQALERAFQVARSHECIKAVIEFESAGEAG